MHLDEQSMRTRGARRLRHRRDVRTMAGAVTWIDDHGKMSQLAEHRNRAEVERVACGCLEGADAAFAEHDLLIADRENVFRSAEPFVDRAGEAALQQDWPVDLAELTQ